MQSRGKGLLNLGLGTAAAVALVFPAAVSAAPPGGAPLHRVVSEFQNAANTGLGEADTTATPLANGQDGTVTWEKNDVQIAHKVVYVTFSAQADTHNDAMGEGSALLMTALIDGEPCEATTGLFDPLNLESGWYTLLKLPQHGASATDEPNNCFDGSGGENDCHDNTIAFSCCAQIDPGLHDFQIRLASSNGGQVFYERSTINIDSSPNPQGDLCTPATFMAP